ncbi:cytochrome P450 [Arcticibacterium luteifluviistationis]|uniref:Cytochrome P450 n=1 Tax=Arcticibacterium luteifluviistationis TaxID=1784714 RepID=A0A2Z4G6L1_9BACT|nr:cytochrome P450 [Arcticibacterium luteifluviistationis]AWV96750.1 cytochrome P450 [Arcticibacterium luteifluviistationis]
MDKKISEFKDPFSTARKEKGIGEMDDQNDPVQMLLRLKDVRKTAHNWKTFQSGAKPGRIVIPSEVDIRETRQLPFELDPPEHTEFRGIVEDWFKRPQNEEYAQNVKKQISSAIDDAMLKESFDMVTDLALPIQSRALTLLFNIPLEEAKVWISWGTHVFRSEGEALDKDKANVLYDYIDEQLEKAAKNPGEDLYSVLLQSEYQGRKITKEEAKGVMVLTFAGGRDTIINALTNATAYFAEHPESLNRLKEEPQLIGKAVEEFVRYFSPLTQMGRVVTEDTYVCEHAAKADTRVSLCWASANRDETVFENPNEIQIDRKMNPHVGFGFSHHKCMGAPHARQVMKIFIEVLTEKVGQIEILDFKENIEELGEFERKVGFHNLQINLKPIA